MKFFSSHTLLFGTLRGRLILGVAVVHAVMMTFFIFDLTAKQRALLLENQEDDAMALAQTLATSAAGWLAANDIAGLQELVDLQQLYPGLVFAILADTGGHILAHSDHARKGQYLYDLPKEAGQVVISKRPELVDVAVPAMLGDRHVGWTRIGIDNKASGKKLAVIVKNGVFYAVAAIIIGSLVAWQLGCFITRRLYAIQQTIARVHQGDRLARSSLSGTDEAAALAGEFNAMLDVLDRQSVTLARSETKLRMLLQNIRVAVIVHGPDTQIRMSNAMAQTLLGLKEEQLLGKEAIDPAWHFLREDGSPLPLAEYPVNQALRARRPIHDQIVGVQRQKDESAIWVIVNASPQFDEQQVITEVVVTFIDITARKLAEEQISELNEELESRVRERTKELENKTLALEQANKLFVGRELRMVELKERISELEEKIRQLEEKKSA